MKTTAAKKNGNILRNRKTGRYAPTCDHCECPAGCACDGEGCACQSPFPEPTLTLEDK